MCGVYDSYLIFNIYQMLKGVRIWRWSVGRAAPVLQCEPLLFNRAALTIITAALTIITAAHTIIIKMGKHLEYDCLLCCLPNIRSNNRKRHCISHKCLSCKCDHYKRSQQQNPEAQREEEGKKEEDKEEEKVEMIKSQKPQLSQNYQDPSSIFNEPTNYHSQGVEEQLQQEKKGLTTTGAATQTDSAPKKKEKGNTTRVPERLYVH